MSGWRINSTQIIARYRHVFNFRSGKKISALLGMLGMFPSVAFADLPLTLAWLLAYHGNICITRFFGTPYGELVMFL